MKRVGILGLPQSGKTTLFEILMQGAGSTAAGREHVGVVRVPDPRVDRLAALFHPRKTTYATVQFVDSVAAGQVSARAAAKGTDLFGPVRQCDALVLVVRDFAAAGEAPDPARDLTALETELILNDLAIVETRIERVARELRVGKKQNQAEHALLERCRALLEGGTPLGAAALSGEEERALRGFQLLSLKPALAVYNRGERAPAAGAPRGHSRAIAIQAHLEREIVGLPAAERQAFRAGLGVEDDGLSLVIRACHELLGLITFFTVGEDEVRAWEIRRGQKAVDAAGEIHTDLARGFIRAEVIEWDRLLEAGSQARARERGWLRLEGRDYEVRDGDCLEIRFNK
jgi:GTP-binding protein YchF